MERPTRTIETPFGKNKVVLKEWLTAGESQKLQKALLSKSKIKFDKASLRENPEDAVNLDDMSADDMLDIQNQMIGVYVKSIDDQSEDILQYALDNLRTDDFDFIVKSINKVEEAEKKD